MRQWVTALAVSAVLLAPACSPKVVGGYYVEEGKVYWTGGIDSSPREVAGADAGSFHKLSSGYARDKAHAYYRGAQIAGADVTTFDWLNYGWAKDRNHIWAGTLPLSGDPDHFETINSDLAKDSGAVYCKDREISDDPAHFEILRISPDDRNLDYTKDIHAVYYRCEAIPGADAATFRRLNDSVFNYAVDNQRAYYQDRVIAGADPHTFRVLYDTANEGCAADAQHAYRWDTVIPDVDPQKFPPGKPVTGCDGTQVTFGP
ncbi:DKNYY domain-containing protein [Mycolicibacterium sp. 141076]|uniref:DKNYY domain-containing protein n=1 Tax=Mycolicibacterium sp. 141076 TaxID=3090599 RepID=UPI00299E3ACC|nr:DKNYY domain-containing protein [Mycolicibacterium sp. 141076]MDX1878038.1 DKNYY domain-containing protein [Mycolicibacterium sp. 141076]